MTSRVGDNNRFRVNIVYGWMWIVTQLPIWLTLDFLICNIFSSVLFSGHHDPRRLSKSTAGDKSDGTSGDSDATNVINNDEEEAEHERQPKQKLIVR